MKWTFFVRLGLAVAGVPLAARALFGPFDRPFAVHSPINAEGWFAIAVAMLVSLRLRHSEASPNGAAPQQGLIRTRYVWAGYACGLALIGAAFAGSIHDYFLADDFILLHYARDFHFHLRRVFATGGGDGFFRPVTNLLFGFTFQWAGTNPLRWHLEGLALHALNTALVFQIVRRAKLEGDAARSRTRSFTAAFAAALFAIHGTRPEAVVWTAGRFDLLAAFFVLLSIALYLRFSDAAGGWRAFWWTASLAAMALGILSKESAYAGPPILALIAILREPRTDRGRAPDSAWRVPDLRWPALGLRWRDVALRWSELALRSRELAPPLAPFFAMAVCLFAYRWVLFGGIGGYLDPSGRPQALLLTPISVIKTLGFRIWAVLMFPLDWDAVSGFAVGIAMVLYLAALAWLTTTRARARDLIAPVGFVLLASIPPLQQLLIGPGMDKSRYLYLPSAGFCWLLAAVAAGLAGSSQNWSRRAVCAAVLVFNLVALESNLAAWHHVATLSRPACVVAASCVRNSGPRTSSPRLLAINVPRWINSAYLFPLGFPDCTRMEFDGLSEATPLEVTMRDAPDGRPTPEEAAAYGCVLAWDPATEQLRQVR